MFGGFILNLKQIERRLKEMRKILDKKGQMGGLENAPSMILIVGLVFLTMATVALIGDKYSNALDTDNTAGAYINESATPTDAGITLVANSLKNGACGTITAVYNTTGGFAITSANYTQTGCTLVNTTSEFPNAWLVNYPYTYSVETVASNATTDLTTEIANNTSIAGIVLTISLIGIVLGILVSIFFGVTNRASRV